MQTDMKLPRLVVGLRISLIGVLCIVLVGCGEDEESAANREFVLITQLISQAETEASTSKKVKLLSEAIEKSRMIVEEYPSSSIATKIASGQSIGNFKLETLEKIHKAEQQPQYSLAGEMVDIPAGTFQMGSNDGDDEEPVHSVTIKSFRLGKYEITQKQWAKVMGNNPSKFIGCDDCPVESVSWNDVQSFIEKLNQKTGGNYGLPSEAEWEYACCSGGKDEKYCGGNNVDNLAWYNNNSGNKTLPVGQRQPNSLGLYDMSGNVLEWTEDCWNKNYSSAPSDGRAWMNGDCSLRVKRGGSWYNKPQYVRSAGRDRSTRTERSTNTGFRLAQDL